MLTRAQVAIVEGEHGHAERVRGVAAVQAGAAADVVMEAVDAHVQRRDVHDGEVVLGGDGQLRLRAGAGLLPLFGRRRGTGLHRAPARRREEAAKQIILSAQKRFDLPDYRDCKP